MKVGEQVSSSTCAVVPIKVESQRLPNKNFLQLLDKPLAHYIFETLLSVKSLDHVYAYCSDPRLMDLLPEGLRWLPRSRELDGNEIRANELFLGAVEQVSEDVVVLAQIPGPFVSAATVERCINALLVDGYRSALTVRSHQMYVWFRDEPLNYSPALIERTQELEPVRIETSGIYAFWRADYLEQGSRIQQPVKLVEVGEIEATDIDTPDDFEWAQQVALARQLHLPAVRLDSGNLAKRAPGPKLKTFRHVALDLDGVLIDSLPVMNRAWDDAMSAVGLDVPFSDYAAQIGRPFQSILEVLGIPEGAKIQVTSIYNETSQELAGDVKAYPLVREGLQQIQACGFRLSIVTSKDRHRTVSLLEENFSVKVNGLICGDDLPPGRGKPNPDPLLLACVKVGATPGESIYVGDMEFDQQAADQAGIQYVHAGWGYGGLSYAPGVWFDSFGRLTEWLVSQVRQQE